MSFGSYDDRHYAKTTPAGRHYFIPITKCHITSFPGETTDGMGKIPEIFESLLLNQIQQRAVREISRRAFPGSSFLTLQVYKKDTDQKKTEEYSFFNRLVIHVHNIVPAGVSFRLS
jgi:hypothetical protein